MPFTPAHAALALPFSRVRFLRFTPLVIGAMVPDVPMFCPFGPRYESTHSLLWSIPVGLPIGLSLLVLFEWAKEPLLALVPTTLRGRWAGAARTRCLRSGRDLLPVCLSLALGILGHIVWDAFTHEHGWGVGFLPWLARDSGFIAGVPLPIYKILQHASTFVGLTALSIRAVRWTRRQPHVEVTPPRLRPLMRLLLWAELGLFVPLTCAHTAWSRAGEAPSFWPAFAYQFTTRLFAYELLILLILAVVLSLSRTQPLSARPL